MHHCSAEDLALAALGEDLPSADAAHLAGCSSCAAEVTSLRRAVDALGLPDGPETAGPVPLPPRVWDAIATATGVGSRPVAPDVPAEARTSGPASVPLPVPRSGTPGAVRAVSTGGPATTPTGEVRALPAHRATSAGRRQHWTVGGAVAASLLIGVGIGAVGVPDGSDDGPAGQSVAVADLAPLEGWDEAGAATLLDRDGELELQVELATPPAGEGFYEVWLLGGDAGALALGVLDGGSGRYLLPAGVDLAEYGTVDVSLEPWDGDPAHSTDSVARGPLG